MKRHCQTCTCEPNKGGHKRRITKEMAVWLKGLVDLNAETKGPVHVRQVTELTKIHGGDYGKLAHWGLVMKAKAMDSANPRGNGYWMPTRLAYLFVKHGRSVPAYYVDDEDGKPAEWSTEMIVFAQCADEFLVADLAP